MSSAQKEINDNDYLFQDQQTVADKRFVVCCQWYIRKAGFYKRLHLILTWISGICPIIAAALNGIDAKGAAAEILKAFLIILSLATSISVLILSTTRAQEKWTRYRMAGEFLKRQRTKHLKERERQPQDMSQCDERFLQAIEEYMAEENKAWETSNKKNGERG